VNSCEGVQAAADEVAAFVLSGKRKPLKQRWQVAKPYCWRRKAVRERNRQERRSRLHGRPQRYGKL